MMYLQTLQFSSRLTEPLSTLNDGVTLFWRTVRNFAKGTAERLPYLIVGALVFVVFWLLGKKHLPSHIPIVFGLTVPAGSWLFVKATQYNRPFLLAITAWIAFQSSWA